MSRFRSSLAISIGLLAAVLMLGQIGCASSSKSKKKKRTILMTEYDDARVGREASQDVAAQMGLLGNRDLDSYITEIGRKLLRGLPRRQFQFNFAVVDQVEPNAFALPGGYVFISRGLLLLANSEDELACVIGHEITHVAHRHAAAQQGLAKHISPVAMPWARAGRMAAYGRDMERDADKGGQLLCAAAGYDPMGMSSFLANLQQTERLRLGYSRGPSFFDSHPGSRERASSNAVRAGEMRWRRDPLLGDTKLRLLRRIDGLTFGQRPEAGVFDGERFIHPDLDFQLRFPSGWQTTNSNAVVGAISPKGDAVVLLRADAAVGDARTVAESWVEKLQEEQSISVKESKRVKIGDFESWRMRLEGGRVVSYVTFIPYRSATWQIAGQSVSWAANKYLGRTLNTTRSFRPLTEEERNSVTRMRLHVVQARRGESFESLGSRSGNVLEPGDTAVYNGLQVNHRFEGGEYVKIARVERYVPKSLEEAPSE